MDKNLVKNIMKIYRSSKIILSKHYWFYSCLWAIY